MKIKFHYGDGVLNLPADLIAVLPRADATALRVLICLAATAGEEVDRDQLLQQSDCDDAALDTALAFWRGTGLITVADGKSEGVTKQKRVKSDRKGITSASESQEKMPEVQPVEPTVVVRSSATALPVYTTEELAALLEKRRELTALVDECSHAFGKTFTNVHEIGQLIALSDYLGLEDEYIVLLLAHCAKIGKKTMRYVTSTAIALYDDGITDTSALQQCLKAREERAEREGQLRAMFGMGSRALTTKEKKMFDDWVTVHGFSMDVIRIAYDKTVNATGKASVPYANSILERWAVAGLKTVEAINEAEAAYEKQSVATPKAGNSFDTDDFFEAALQRSFGDAHAPDGKK